MNFSNFLVLLLIQLQAGLNEEKSEELEDEGVAGDHQEIKILSTEEQVWPSQTRPLEIYQDKNTTEVGGFRASQPDIYIRNLQTPRVVEHSEFTQDFDKNTGNVEIFQNTIKSEPTSNSNRFQLKKKVQYPQQHQISRTKSTTERNLLNSFTNRLTATLRPTPTATLRPTLTPRLTPRLRARPDYHERQSQDFPATGVELRLTPDRADYGKGQNDNIFTTAHVFFMLWYNLPCKP